MLECDVLVVGGGNASLVSAITCAKHERNVLLVESSPMHERGANTCRYCEGYCDVWDFIERRRSFPAEEVLPGRTFL